jgi:TalC/MipB family fructose-6-phosphate aldolase
MQLWMDTIDFDVIEDAARLGILTGVTTNPTILAGSDKEPEIVIRKLLDVQPGMVAVQTTETELLPIVKQACRIAKISKRLIIKIPAMNDGFRAIPILEKEGVPTLATTIYETRQIVLASMLGATYAAPYLDKIETATGDGFGVLSDAQHILSREQSRTKIMGAAIVNARQFSSCANIGIGAITLPADVYRELFSSNEHMESSLSAFNSAWTSNDLTYQSHLFKQHQ